MVVCHPDDVKQVFTGDPNVLHAGEGNAILRPLLGARSVLLLDGPEHLRERKTLLPPFHGERMQAYGELIREIAEREVASWPTGEPISVRPRMQALTLEIIMRAVFGSTRRAAAQRSCRALLDWMTDTAAADARRRSPARGSSERAFRRMRAPIDALLNDEIARRRAAPDLAEREDILSMLLGAPTMDDATSCATSC